MSGDAVKTPRPYYLTLIVAIVFTGLKAFSPFPGIISFVSRPDLTLGSYGLSTATQSSVVRVRRRTVTQVWQVRDLWPVLLLELLGKGNLSALIAKLLGVNMRMKFV